MLVSLAQEVETAVASGNPATRMLMLRRTTDLFLDHSGRLGDREVLAFETVLLKLARNVEAAARAALAESLSDAPAAPRVVVQDLARDADIAVAAPVLMRSSQISESDLLQIAEERGQAHLFALSRRRTLSERVTDVLLSRGDEAVLRSVAGNEGARISTDGFDRLAAQADLDEALQAALLFRRDVPAQHLAHLAATVELRVARKLRDEFGAEAARKAVARATRTFTGDQLSLEDAANLVDLRLAKTGAPSLDEADVYNWLADGRVMEALVALARNAYVPPDVVLRAYQAAHYDPLLFLIRSIRFSWGTFKLFLESKPGRSTSPDDLAGAFEAFQALSVATAQRVVRFTAARDQVQRKEAPSADTAG